VSNTSRSFTDTTGTPYLCAHAVRGECIAIIISRSYVNVSDTSPRPLGTPASRFTIIQFSNYSYYRYDTAANVYPYVVWYYCTVCTVVNVPLSVDVERAPLTLSTVLPESLTTIERNISRVNKVGGGGGARHTIRQKPTCVHGELNAPHLDGWPTSRVNRETRFCLKKKNPRKKTENIYIYIYIRTRSNCLFR